MKEQRNGKNAKGKNVKGKKERNIIKPKRILKSRRSIIRAARSSWISFLCCTRDKKLAEYEGLTFGDMCKTLSPIWRRMNEEERLPFVRMYKEDRTRYEQEKANLSEEDKKTLRIHKRIRRILRAGRPKAALSPFMIYVVQNRSSIVADIPGMSFEAIGKELGKRWRELLDVDKEQYNMISKIDRARFHNELKEYKDKIKQNKLDKRNERMSKKQKAKTKKSEL